MTPFSAWKMISLSPKSKFEHKVGMPIPRLTIQPSSNSIASRSHICWRVSPLVSLIPQFLPLACGNVEQTTSTQSSQWIRKGREGSEPVDQPNDTVAHLRDMKIKQNAQFEPTQPQIT